jgi:hypothetical protein
MMEQCKLSSQNDLFSQQTLTICTKEPGVVVFLFLFLSCLVCVLPCLIVPCPAPMITLFLNLSKQSFPLQVAKQNCKRCHNEPAGLSLRVTCLVFCLVFVFCLVLICLAFVVVFVFLFMIAFFFAFVFALVFILSCVVLVSIQATFPS